jgi:hypothetical protein
MDFDLEATARLRSVTNYFATSADRGESVKALQLLSDTFGYGVEGQLKPKGALANILMMRQVSEYETRHHTMEPTMTLISPDRISGIVPITSTKKEDGKVTVSVNEFHVTIIPVGDGWKIDRLNMVPFASGTLGEM